MKTAWKILFCFSICLQLVSCSTARKYAKQRIRNGNEIDFVYFKRGSAPEDSILVKKIGAAVKIAYFAGQSEVSNKQYWRFLESLKETDPGKYQEHKPKTGNWKKYSDSFTIADSMALYYDSLGLFRNHPVVNITPLDALAFIEWLNRTEPDSTVRYRLFSTEEWLEVFNETKGIDSSFAWGGNYWRNKYNNPLANYSEFDQDQIRYDHIKDKITWANADSLGYSSFINGPMPVYSYNPNCWGAYNMSGNVAELTTNYIRINQQWRCYTHGGSWHSPVFYLRKAPVEEYVLPSPYVGFRVLKIQAELPKK